MSYTNPKIHPRKQNQRAITRKICNSKVKIYKLQKYKVNPKHNSNHQTQFKTKQTKSIIKSSYQTSNQHDTKQQKQNMQNTTYKTKKIKQNQHYSKQTIILRVNTNNTIIHQNTTNQVNKQTTKYTLYKININSSAT